MDSENQGNLMPINSNPVQDGSPYFMGQHSLIHFSTMEDGYSPRTFWLLDKSNHTIRPFESEKALQAAFGPGLQEAKQNAVSITPPSIDQHGNITDGVLTDFTILDSEHAVRDDGTAKPLPFSPHQLRQRYGQPVNEDAEDKATQAIDGFLNHLKKNKNETGLSVDFINNLKKDEHLMAFYVSALAYGNYTLNDIYRDILQRNHEDTLKNTSNSDGGGGRGYLAGYYDGGGGPGYHDGKGGPAENTMDAIQKFTAENYYQQMGTSTPLTITPSTEPKVDMSKLTPVQKAQATLGFTPVSTFTNKPTVAKTTSVSSTSQNKKVPPFTPSAPTLQPIPKEAYAGYRNAMQKGIISPTDALMELQGQIGKMYSGSVDKNLLFASGLKIQQPDGSIVDFKGDGSGNLITVVPAGKTIDPNNVKVDTNTSAPIPGLPSYLQNVSGSNISPEALSSLSALTPGSPEYKAAFDSLTTQYFDVLQQQLNAQNEQESAAANYNWNNFKKTAERALGITLADNAAQAFGQIQGLRNQFSFQNISGSGIEQESIDDYLKKVRTADQSQRLEHNNKEETQQHEYLTKFGTPDQIKSFVDANPNLAYAWGLKPTAQITAASLKQQFPNYTDDQIKEMLATHVDENGNYRSNLYQKYVTGSQLGVQQGEMGTPIKDQYGNVIYQPMRPSDTGTLDIAAAKRNQIMTNEFTPPVIPRSQKPDSTGNQYTFKINPSSGMVERYNHGNLEETGTSDSQKSYGYTASSSLGYTPGNAPGYGTNTKGNWVPNKTTGKNEWIPDSDAQPQKEQNSIQTPSSKVNQGGYVPIYKDPNDQIQSPTNTAGKINAIR